jgi:hypothetical protein
MATPAIRPLPTAHSTGLKQAAILATVPAAYTHCLLPFHHQPGCLKPHLTSKKPHDGSGAGGSGVVTHSSFGVLTLTFRGGFGVEVVMKTRGQTPTYAG